MLPLFIGVLLSGGGCCPGAFFGPPGLDGGYHVAAPPMSQIRPPLFRWTTARKTMSTPIAPSTAMMRVRTLKPVTSP